MDELVALSKYFYSLQQSGYCDIKDVYRLVIFDYIKSIKASLLTTEELAIINKALQCLYTSCYIEDIACCGEVIPLDYKGNSDEEGISPIDVNTIYTKIAAIEKVNERQDTDLLELNVSVFKKADSSSVYTIAQANAKFATLNDTYTKAQVNAKVGVKADRVSVVEVPGTTVVQELLPNTFYKFDTVDSLTITLGTPLSEELSIYACSFTAATDDTTLTLPATIIGEAPTITAGHRYELNIMDNVLLYTENGND